MGLDISTELCLRLGLGVDGGLGGLGLASKVGLELSVGVGLSVELGLVPSLGGGVVKGRDRRLEQAAIGGRRRLQRWAGWRRMVCGRVWLVRRMVGERRCGRVGETGAGRAARVGRRPGGGRT